MSDPDHRDLGRYFRHFADDVLREGMTGDVCINLRLALDRLGFPSGPTLLEPRFDRSLTEAVVAFQGAHNARSRDGQCGPGTRRLLVDLLLDKAGAFAFERMTDPEKRRQGHAFVSYARDDLARVRPFIELAQGWGYTVWYDDAISGGSIWSNTLREKVEGAFLVLAFLTPHSVSREWVRTEIEHADMAGAPILPVVLQELPKDYELRKILSKYQFLSEAAISFDFLDDGLAAKLADALRTAHAARPAVQPPPPPPLS